MQSLEGCHEMSAIGDERRAGQQKRPLSLRRVTHCPLLHPWAPRPQRLSTHTPPFKPAGQLHNPRVPHLAVWREPREAEVLELPARLPLFLSLTREVTTRPSDTLARKVSRSWACQICATLSLARSHGVEEHPFHPSPRQAWDQGAQVMEPQGGRLRKPRSPSARHPLLMRAHAAFLPASQQSLGSGACQLHHGVHTSEVTRWAAGSAVRRAVPHGRRSQPDRS